MSFEGGSGKKSGGTQFVILCPHQRFSNSDTISRILAIQSWSRGHSPYLRRIEEGSVKAIYVISMEDSERPFGRIMASLCIRARGIHLNRKPGRLSACDAHAAFGNYNSQWRRLSCRELHLLRLFADRLTKLIAILWLISPYVSFFNSIRNKCKCVQHKTLIFCICREIAECVKRKYIA